MDPLDSALVYADRFVVARTGPAETRQALQVLAQQVRHLQSIERWLHAKVATLIRTRLDCQMRFLACLNELTDAPEFEVATPREARRGMLESARALASRELAAALEAARSALVLDMEACLGCASLRVDCGPAAWAEQRKCCPDCTHSAAAFKPPA